MNPRECLIVFTRHPEPGTTKTRLIARLGSRGAADLQRRMTEHVMARVLPLKRSRRLDVQVRFDGGDERLMQAWLGDGVTYARQGAGDIGARMARALGAAARQGYTAMVVIGTDIPDISTKLLAQAFEALSDDTVVLGPASDGGYYLVGLSPKILTLVAPSLFADLPWGAATVLSKTCQRLDRMGVAYRFLETLDDVDRPEDLPVWERIKCQ